MQVCKAKYEDVRKRYSGSLAWFDELRKVRMAELKRELEKSEDSIGSLESKIKNLKTKKKPLHKADCGSDETESPVAMLRSEGNDSSLKETSKDELSAGSFTLDTRTSCSLDQQVPPVQSSSGPYMKQENLESFEEEKGSIMGKLADVNNREGVTPRKRRGKRKRKDCSAEAKEGSVAESDNLGSNNVVPNSLRKETSTSGVDQTIKFVSRDGDEKGSCPTMNDSLIGIFNSIAEHKVAFVFRHRLDSQKRARYKKIIRQHIDFDIIRSKVISCSVRSVKELFRDLLLLANNALVFYSKRTREYKSGVALRDIVLETYRQHCKHSYDQATSVSLLPMAPLYNPPVKPRSARPRPFKPKVLSKLDNAKNIAAGSAPKVHPKPSDVDTNLPLQALLVAKKGLKRPTKTKNGSAKAQPKGAAPITKDKKRARQR
ncbi:OLC1v1021649C4 [Oldenlandia corymbosa var. corymbosa]|uniref:OLC1v1021649C4 n=1 Tax=Oldenlandia corymbosa var. corymbosa TaxID=529605 RepID=A0AAV1BYL7_OLDCO|nr:OLC1v1021649C4 [Oldenlandia corymbosa var. corymbosa]